MATVVENAGFSIIDQLMWVFGTGFPKSHNLKGEYQGYGTALKPAHEPIVVARKPIEGTVAQNFKKYGTGAMHIDACRIEGEPWTFGTQTDIRGGKFNDSRPSEGDVFRKNVTGGEDGRWPANLIHDGSDEVLSAFPDSKGQQGDLKGHNTARKSPNGIFGEFAPAKDRMKRNDSSKSAARFFYVAKTSRKDRNEGCEDLPDQKGGMVSNTSGQHITRRDEDYKPEPVKNNHPTVKPTELMQYLIRLVTRPGGLVLDPFMGSGSTGKAAIYEDMFFVGIDMTPEYLPIAKARINFALKNSKKGTQISML